MKAEVPIRDVRAEAFTVPTDRAEADGTIAWNSTTLVLVEVEGGGKVGIGYTYSHACIGGLIRDKLAATIAGKDAMAPQACFAAMQRGGTQSRARGADGHGNLRHRHRCA